MSFHVKCYHIIHEFATVKGAFSITKLIRANNFVRDRKTAAPLDFSRGAALFEKVYLYKLSDRTIPVCMIHKSSRIFNTFSANTNSKIAL